MGSAGKLLEAVFKVPLLLSSLLLRALGPARGKRNRRARRSSRTPGVHPAAGAYGQLGPVARQPPVPSAEVKRMSQELGLVLDAHQGSRDVFRYLAYFESRLRKKGLRALDDMSAERLRRALAQLEAIVTNWSQADLAGLRSRMAVALSRHTVAALWAPAQTISTAYTARPMPLVASSALARTPARESNRPVEVEDDVSMSRFEAAGGEWHYSEQPPPRRPNTSRHAPVDDLKPAKTPAR